MKTMNRFLATGLCTAMAFSVVSCGGGWINPCVKSRLYNMGEEITSTVGDAMVQDGCFAKRFAKRGTLPPYTNENSQDDEYFKAEPKLEKELIYSGREGNVIHIAYREYTWNGLAKTAFSQQLVYDLSKSETIAFKEWVIKVQKADNNTITFKVIKEPARAEHVTP